jgi:selenide,water dikinase
LAQVLRHVTKTATDPAVLIGLEEPDDAAVYRLSGDMAFVQTVDFFTPIVDDPADWGRIAAANALSDVYAMGAKPLTALNLVGWPRSLDFSILGRVLEGGDEMCRRAGVTVVGGHSIDDPEPKFGLAVTGSVHPERIVRKTSARPGATLVLTKPLGTGIVSTAIKAGVAPEDSVGSAVAWMTSLNRAASEAMTEIGVQAATDVTGFGLVGHLSEMLRDGLGASLRFDRIPLLPGAPELAAQGHIAGGTRRNRVAAEERVTFDESIDEALRWLVFDAQTSGGLLIAVDEARVGDLEDALRTREVAGAVVGTVEEGDGIEVRRG